MKCQDCRFWSEMVAQSIGCSPIEALCLNEESPLRMKMTTELNGCQFGKERVGWVPVDRRLNNGS